MGLTGGIADVGSLSDSLIGIHTGQADDSILDKYDEVRRKIWHDIINPVSSENMRRLFDLDADTALEKDPFLKMLKQVETSGPVPGQEGSVSAHPGPFFLSPLQTSMIMPSYPLLILYRD